jgi:hypothetical protein
MRKLGVALVAVVLAVGVPASASAGNSGQAFLGDLNNDGRADRVTLGPVGTSSTCTLTVEYRRANGAFRPAVTHTYTSPVTHAPYCPNMGEVVNLGGNRVAEIVAANFSSYSPGRDLLVLRRFQPVAQFEGISFPSTLRKVDFNGDGLEDVWQSSDQVVQLKSWLNTPAGTLVPGPIDVCSSAPIPQHAFADFDGDGGQDMLLSRRCEFSYTTAELHFGGGGAPVVFGRSPYTSTTYEVFVTDLDNDQVPDVGVIERTGGTVTVRHFRNDGTGSFTERV